MHGLITIQSKQPTKGLRRKSERDVVTIGIGQINIIYPKSENP